MNTTLDDAFGEVCALVRDFEAHRNAYLAASYSEAQARQDFIDKFFTAIGWDVGHNRQKNPFEQEVKVENKVVMEGTQRRADYAFFLLPNYRDVRFYAEAKKPSRNIATQDNYFQTIRYGWNSATPLALLTDFACFHVLDCRYKPDIDTALQREVLKYEAKDLLEPENFAKLYFLFSREAVEQDSLQKFADSLPKRRGSATGSKASAPQQSIDDAFLEELDDCRETLAKAFKHSKPDLDGETLTELAQRTLDRLVFLRFLEDKLIETKESVAGFAAYSNAWATFVVTSRRLDSIYNGIIFKKHEILDDPHLSVDQKSFTRICRVLSDPHSPYNFDAIPIYILGSIYERFLGKVIVTTDKRARVEIKPEVRKAGGVYYTPEYVVRDMVARSVGKSIEGKSPTQLASMRFADIACGSGSFLLGIVDVLFDHHLAWYNTNKDKAKPTECFEHQDGTLRLTLQKKREIIVNCIYGVDIDRQAVEVAQLSIYLKLLEDETTATARNYQLEFHQALLPPLNRNLVCGNSLVGTEIFSEDGFSQEELRKINPLDMRQAFPTVIKEGGFHVVIGNPPYVNAWKLFEDQPHIREYLSVPARYKTADRHWDLYVLFIERALSLVRSKGRVSYIIPYSYCLQKYAEVSRRWLLSDFTIESIADIRTVQVFRDVPVITVIPTIVKEKPTPKQKIEVLLPVIRATGKVIEAFEISHKTPRLALLQGHEAMFRLDLTKDASSLIKTIESNGITLGKLCYVNYGAQMSSKAGAHPKFGKQHVLRESKVSNTCRPMISGRELYRHEILWEGRYVEWALADQMYGSRWPGFFELPKLMIRDLTGTHRLETALDLKGFYCDHTVLCALRHCDVAEWKPLKDDQPDASGQYDMRFLAGVVGSTVISAYSYLVLSGEGVRTGGGFHTYPQSIRALPIPRLDASNKGQVKQAETIANYVDRLAEAKKKSLLAKSDRDKEFHAKQAQSIDEKIDELVAQMFGLSASEIAIANRMANGTE